MLNGEKYSVFWKGKEVGKFSRAEMSELSERGTIGLMHIVKTSAGDVFLRDFLFGKEKTSTGSETSQQSDVSENSTVAQPVKKEEMQTRGMLPASSQIMIFGLCGASFVSAWIWAASLVLCAYLWTSGNKRLSLIGVAISSFLFALGWVFFNLAVPVLRG